MKQNASVDASFWINICAGNIAEFVSDYFDLFAPNVVAAEIRYPLDTLGMTTQTAVLFNMWVQQGKIILQDPIRPVDWFQQGENAAIALAIEQQYILLMDDANPYHRAKAAGLGVIGSSEFAVFLYDKGRISYEKSADAIRQTHASKAQKRDAMIVLENLKRRKER